MKDISLLVVDDDIDLLNRLVSYLSIFFDTIYKANNGNEALSLYKKNVPNIIITDINMPKITGIEFIQEIRKIDKSTQIIILSAHTNTEDFLKIVPLNLVSYLVKPIQMEELKKTIITASQRILETKRIILNNGYMWNEHTKCLLLEEQKINLTSNENAFLDILITKINQNVSFEEIHNHIYNLEEYSQDAIFTIVKRIRKKTTKDLIKSSYKYGYVLESE